MTSPRGRIISPVANGKGSSRCSSSSRVTCGSRSSRRDWRNSRAVLAFSPRHDHETTTASHPPSRRRVGRRARATAGAAAGSRAATPRQRQPGAQILTRTISSAPTPSSAKASPKAKSAGPFTLPSQAYPGTQHTYWVYVPAQYDKSVPASLMIFNDGQAFKNMEGDIRAPERPRQPDLPARDPGDARGVHQPGPHARAARADAAGLGRPRRPTARPNTTRSTTSTRASSSTS